MPEQTGSNEASGDVPPTTDARRPWLTQRRAVVIAIIAIATVLAPVITIVGYGWHVLSLQPEIEVDYVAKYDALLEGDGSGCAARVRLARAEMLANDAARAIMSPEASEPPFAGEVEPGRLRRWRSEALGVLADLQGGADPDELAPGLLVLDEADDAIAWLDALDDAIEVVRSAGACPRLGGRHALPASGTFATGGLLMPYLAELREAARLLAAHAWRTRDGTEYVADVVAILGLARLAESSGVLISVLTSNAIEQLALRSVRVTLVERAEMLDDAALNALALALEEARGTGPSAEVIVETDMIRALVQASYSPGRDGVFLAHAFVGQGLDVDVGLSSATMPVASIGGAISSPRRGEIEDALDAWVERGRVVLESDPWTVTPAQLAAIDGPIGLSTSIPARVIELLRPAIARTVSRVQTLRFERDGVRVAIAVTRHRMETGAWPSDASDLVPAFLDEVPRDPFDGQPLRFGLVDGGFRVWSVGHDLDDDGGAEPRAPGDVEAIQSWPGNAAVVALDGDWLLWASDHRRFDDLPDADRLARERE